MIRSILVVLDNSGCAPFVLAAASEIGESFEAELHLFRVLEGETEASLAEPLSNRPELVAAQLRLSILGELKTLAAGNPRALHHPPVLGRGGPASAIVAASIERSVDLIVLGSHQLLWLQQLLGATAESIALRARCNILVVNAPRNGEAGRRERNVYA